MVYKKIYNNFEIIIAQNKKENNKLIKEMIKNKNLDDILWLQLRNVCGPYGFIKGSNPDIFIIYKAAYYIKMFSYENKCQNTIIEYTKITNIIPSYNKLIIKYYPNTICI